MRISDWSSDVCSSDLAFAPPPGRRPSETRGPCVRRSPARRSNLLDLAVRSATGRTVRETLPLLSSPSSNPLARLGERSSYPVPRLFSNGGFGIGVERLQPSRSEERRVGKEGVSTVRS